MKKPQQSKGSADLNFKAKLKRLDLLGLLFIVSATTSLLLALTWGGTRYPWSSWRIILLFCASFALVAIFVVVQKNLGEDGTVPPALLRRDVIVEMTACCLLGFATNAASNVINYWLPVWFQVVKNDSPLTSAVKILPQVLSFAVVALLSGPCVTFLGHWGPIIVCGSMIMTTGAGLLTRLTLASPTAAWIGYEVMFGAGFGLILQAPVSLLQEIFDDNDNDISMATALVILCSQLGRKSLCNNNLASTRETRGLIAPFSLVRTFHRSNTFRKYALAAPRQLHTRTGSSLYLPTWASPT